MKDIKINYDLCTGCGTCELACSLHHHGVLNPKKSRIRVVRNTNRGQFFPLISGPQTETECRQLTPVVIMGKEFNRCSLCRAICPSRELFKDPETGAALTCDRCSMCVRFCRSGALSLAASPQEKR